jgi:hypothetical protein
MGERDPYEWNTHLGHIAAYVLIGGLALELLNGWIWFHGVETAASMVAVLLIGGGVWGEVHFGNKARIEGDKVLAEYKARADEANARALEAKLALERIKTPRTLSAAQSASIADRVKAFEGTPFSLTVFNDQESLLFMDVVEAALSRGKWVLQSALGTGLSGRKLKGGQIVRHAPVDGCFVFFPKSKEAEWGPPAAALAKTLTDAGHSTLADAVDVPENQENAIRVVIGKKPM